MKKNNILYWIATGLIAATMLLSGIAGIIARHDPTNPVTSELHFPAYFLVFIGIAKILGVIALVVPGFPRLKEWAYAGFTFDLLGAIFATIASGMPVSRWAPILVFLAVLAVSYIYYHKRRTPVL